MKNLYDRLASLGLGIWLMTGVIVLLAIGSFSGGGAESSSINDMALFSWLREAPLSLSWWLWLVIALLAIMAANTVLCSIDSLRNKYLRANFLVLIAPQVMHAGFLFIVLAHLFSAYGGLKGAIQVAEGDRIPFPDGSSILIQSISGEAGPMGMLSGYSAVIQTTSQPAPNVVSPNHPLFHNGYGIYLKDVQLLQPRMALMEVHREPGAGLALAGAILFTVGNVTLLAVRRSK